MLTYKAKIATTNIDSNGMRFTKEALEEASKGKQDVPVVVYGGKHNPIGQATKIEYIDGELVAHVELKPINTFGLYLVPFGVVDHKEIFEDADGTRVLRSFKIMSLLSTRNPADPTLTELERDNEDRD